MKESENIIMPGDKFAAADTVEWADWQRSRMKSVLQDVHFEARQIVGVIREMCKGKKPAWHLMTRQEGKSGFRTFEEFVKEPDGLGYGDYVKFRNMAISEPGNMNEREYDLLTTAPTFPGKMTGEEPLPPGGRGSGHTRIEQLRAIGRAPALIRRLYTQELIDAKLAELLGPDEKASGYPERKEKADRAIAAIKAVHRNGDPVGYRQAVNGIVREVFAKKPPTTLEKLQKLWEQATDEEKQQFRALIKGK